MERNKFERELFELGFDERFYESPPFDYDGAPPKSAAPMIPALLKPLETSPPSQTLYAQISLGISTAPNKVDRKTGAPTPDAKFFKVKPLTGIYLPPNFTAQTQIDIVLYLHGHKTKFPGSGARINEYWNGGKFPFFALREAVAESGRNIVFVAPTLGPLSQPGNLTTDKGFDHYLAKVVAALNEHFVRRNSQTEIKNIGKIILAAHSGGGSPMLRIAELKRSVNAAKIAECWGFDSVYGDVEKRWANWAAARPKAAFYTYYNDTAGRSKTLAKIAAERNLPNVCVAGWSARDFKNWAGSRPDLNKVSVSPHFWVSVVYLKERLENAACRAAAVGAASREVSDTFGAFDPRTDFEFALNSAELFKGKIAVAGVPRSKDQRKKAKKNSQPYIEIEESPSVFLPEIVRMAKSYALKDGKSSVAAVLDSANWFKQLTRDFMFLGRPLKNGQYVHIEMAKMLKSAETEFMKILNVGDAKKAGDIFLNNSTEGISGSRKTSSTATFSMHMFGLAVDVNYLGNPFVESANDIKFLNLTLKNAAALMNAEPLAYAQFKTGKLKDRYDYVKSLDTVLENYFALLDKPDELRQLVLDSQSSDWRGLTLPNAQAKIQKNLKNLAGVMARGEYVNYFKKHAILDFDKRFVVGMETLGFDWGGHYGDMMHFDLRKTGVGFYIEKARKAYSAKVRKQAERLWKEKKYGAHSPE